MGAPCSLVLAVFALMFAFSFTRKPSGHVPRKRSGGDLGLSVVFFAPCRDVPSAAFRIDILLKTGETKSLNFSGRTRRLNLDEKIPSHGITHVKITSRSELCFHSLVIDLTIFVDMPTEFKRSCDQDRDSFSLCKELENSELEPVPVCPQAVTSLLKNNNFLTTDPSAPSSGSEEFQLPEYDIRGDMAQASKAIFDGVSEGSRKFASRTMTLNKLKLDSVVGKVSTFLRAAGPALNVLGGLASILTTLFTPNPFDEMCKYISKEFAALHRRLDRMEGELSKLIKSEHAVTRMADKLDAIRYSMRDYEELVNSLSQKKVCDINTLLNSTDVEEFLESFKMRDTMHKLLDLMEVEDNGILGTRSLLNPFMRANCKSRPNKVKAFMRGITVYALQGTRAYMTYKSLSCLKREEKNCEGITLRSLGNDYGRKLHQLLFKAQVLKVAATNATEGLRMEFHAKFLQIVDDQYTKFDEWGYKAYLKMEKFFFHKLFSRYDWPEKCFLNQNSEDLVLAMVARQDDVGPISRDTPLWLSMSNDIHFYDVSLRIKLHVPKGSEERPHFRYVVPHSLEGLGLDPNVVTCKRKFSYEIAACRAKLSSFRVIPKVSKQSRFIFLEFNELEKPTGSDRYDARFDFQIYPIDIYFTSIKVLNNDKLEPPPYLFGCWEGSFWNWNYACPGADNPPENALQHFFVIVGHNAELV